MVVVALLPAELVRLLPLRRQHHHLPVARATRATHALDGSDDVHHVEEHDEVHRGDVEALLADGGGDDGVERARAKRVQNSLLLLLRLALPPSSRPGAASAASARVTLTDELGNLDATARAVVSLTDAGEIPDAPVLLEPASLGDAASSSSVAAAAVRGVEHPRDGTLSLSRVHLRRVGFERTFREGHLAERADDVVHRIAETREHDDARSRVTRRKVSP